MGLSSSQARLLNLTTRMHQIEYKAAKIEAEKLQMANESRRAYLEYQNAMERTKIQYKSINSDGSATFLDATLAALENYGISSYTGVTASKVFLLQNATTNEIYVTTQFAREHGITDEGNAPNPGNWDDYLANHLHPQYPVAHSDRDKTFVDTENKIVCCPKASDVIYHLYKYVTEELHTQIDSQAFDFVNNLSSADLAQFNNLLMFVNDGVYTAGENVIFSGILEQLGQNLYFTNTAYSADNSSFFNSDQTFFDNNHNLLDRYSDYLFLVDGELNTNAPYYEPEAYNNLLKEWQEKKALFDANGYYVIIDDELAKNKDFLNNHLTTNQSILIDWELYNKGEENPETSVATNTFFQEVDDEKELRKAEAKYEADMRRIDMKDRKYDYDLAALDAERNAVKQEMETLKTVARDNVERTFKLFG